MEPKEHAVGDAVWVFCHIIPKGGTRKLLRAWRGPHKVTDVLQDGRQYVLDTGQKVHFEQLKKHLPAPWDTQSPTPSQVPPYQLRRNRAPRYRCGTCGSRNCSCVDLIQVKPPDNRFARGVDAPTLTLADTDTSKDHEQHTTWAVQTKNQDVPQVHHIVITIEKTYSSIGPGVVPPLETTLKAMHGTSPSDCPTYRFKEWTRYDKSGLEFNLTAIIPPLPPSMIFGEIGPEDTNIAMVRCTTAQKLWQQFGVTSPPGDVYHPITGCWLLVSSLDEVSPVTSGILLICL